MFNVLEKSARQIHEKGGWNDGWIAVRETLRYDGQRMVDALRQRLIQLGKLLKPIDLLQQARVFALSDGYRDIDLADDLPDDSDGSAIYHKAEETTRKIGAEVAQNPEMLNTLLPEIVSSRGSRLPAFGSGLSDGCKDRNEMFQMICAETKKTSPEERNLSVLLGFLRASAQNDPVFYNAALDVLINDDVLGEWFPIFQTTGTIDRRGIERLHAALNLGKAQVEVFKYLAWGRAHESISDDDLAELLSKILSKQRGANVAMEILQMRFHGRNEQAPKISASLIAISRDLLVEHTFDEKLKRQDNHDLNLAQLTRICLTGEEGIATATQISRKLAKAITETQIFASDYHELLNSLAETQPRVFLDVFFAESTVDSKQRRRTFGDHLARYGHPLEKISDRELLSWCEVDPAVRYPVITSAISPFRKAAEENKLEWKNIVLEILKRAPDLNPILKNLPAAIMPSSWSGSLADILQKRLVLFADLHSHDNSQIRAWAKAQYAALQESIRAERDWEAQRSRERNERFE